MTHSYRERSLFYFNERKDALSTTIGLIRCRCKIGKEFDQEHSNLMVIKNGKMAKMDFGDLAQRQRDYIRRNNDPIEIDQGIHYPER